MPLCVTDLIHPFVTSLSAVETRLAMNRSATGELVTPTGAALVRVLSSEFGRPPLFVPLAIGERCAEKCAVVLQCTNERAMSIFSGHS